MIIRKRSGSFTFTLIELDDYGFRFNPVSSYQRSGLTNDVILGYLWKKWLHLHISFFHFTLLLTANLACLTHASLSPPWQWERNGTALWDTECILTAEQLLDRYQPRKLSVTTLFLAVSFQQEDSVKGRH